MPKTIYTSGAHDQSGIDITYTKTRNVLWISGWYDNYVGIGGKEYTLTQLFKELEIPPSKIKQALKELHP